jgi:hypothetical protein
MIYSFNTQPKNFFESHSSSADAVLYKSAIHFCFGHLIWSHCSPPSHSFWVVSSRGSMHLPSKIHLSGWRSWLWAAVRNTSQSRAKSRLNSKSMLFQSFQRFEIMGPIGNSAAEPNLLAILQLLCSNSKTYLLLTVLAPRVQINSLGTSLSKPHHSNVEG